MINFKQIVADFSSIAYHHPQVMSFGVGDLNQCTMDVQTKEEPKYTRMYVVPGNVTLNEYHIHYNFSVIIMDIVNNDLSNLPDVLSDTLEIAKDVWTIFFQSYNNGNGNFSNEIVGDESPDIIPFTERFESTLGGWTINLSLSHPYDYNSCTVPIDFGYGFPQDESFESYRVIVNDFKRFAELHYQIESFGFGDIHQLTNDIITKEEPKYTRMYVVPDLTQVHTGHLHHRWKIIICDKLNDDLSNQVDVLSDTLEICKDLFTKMYLSEYEVDWDASVEPFLEEFETTLAGWTLSVSATQKYDYNRCVLPELPFRLTWSQVKELWKNAGIKWSKI